MTNMIRIRRRGRNGKKVRKVPSNIGAGIILHTMTIFKI